MRHANHNRKFGREKNARHALMKSLSLALVTTGKIKTTEAKAKELRPFVEKLVTLGKSETPAARRLLEARVGKSASNKLANSLAAQYKSRSGGYTRITKLVRRNSDGAPMAVIEFI